MRALARDHAYQQGLAGQRQFAEAVQERLLLGQQQVVMTLPQPGQGFMEVGQVIQAGVELRLHGETGYCLHIQISARRALCNEQGMGGSVRPALTQQIGAYRVYRRMALSAATPTNINPYPG